MTDAIKLPSRDIVNIAPQVGNIAEIEQFLFQDIGGTSLINLVRHDTISGIDVVYSIISNLSKLNIDFDPSLILVNKAVYQSIFNQYSIQLMSRVPQETFYSLNEQRPPDNLGTNVYFDGEDLVIEFENVRQTEFIEIEIETDGKINSVRENDY
jgi:hypothetical protein